MKKVLILMLALATGLLPVMGASPEWEKAVELSAPESKASLGSICLAVYKAVKAEPDKAADIFEDVIEQRTTWKVSECVAIFKAVLMALPDEKRNLARYARSYRGGKDAKSAPSVDGPDPIINRMLDALHRASLEDGVPEQVFNELIDTPDEVFHDWGPPPAPIDYFVTPEDSSTGV
ncbi:MAG: hypothetical protein IJ943_01975 [Akkermansia sp.]|nr:hypothetical protein [Akkermansia sp.]